MEVQKCNENKEMAAFMEMMEYIPEDIDISDPNWAALAGRKAAIRYFGEETFKDKPLAGKEDYKMHR